MRNLRQHGNGRVSRNRTRVQKNRTNSLAIGVFAAFFMLGACVLVAIISTQVASANNPAGSNCFFLSWNGKQLCDSSRAVVPDATYSGTPMIAESLIDMQVVSATPTLTFTPIVTLTPMVTSTPQATLTPANSHTSTPGTRLAADLWRKLPIVPEFSLRAQDILRGAARNPDLDPHTFIKVGDCQMVAGIFLAGYANGKYNMPEGMSETVQWFFGSITTDNITAMNGYGINTVFDPAFALSAGYNQCVANETPLDCELRTRRPTVVLIGMGTNWIPHGEVSFERYLREMVDKVLETGALPILATKADNVEGDWKLNEAIAQVAHDYDLPLVNVWQSVQSLPNHGLEKPPRQVYLTGDGWMKRNHAWLVTLDNIRKMLSE